MHGIRKLKVFSVLLAMLMLFTCVAAVADERTTGKSALSEPSAANEQQPTSSPSFESISAPQEKNEEPQRVEHSTEPPADQLGNEAPLEEAFDEMPGEVFVQTAPVSEDLLLEPTPDANEEPLAETPGLLLDFTVRWAFDAHDGSLRLGDTIALEAEIVSETAGLQLQWQVATKPTKLLEENEDEWADIPGARDLKHTFIIEEGMQLWRWRLLIGLSSGEVAFSGETMLPLVASADEAEAQEEAVLGAEDIDGLPTAKITFATDVPADEITFGTRIELIAEIENPRAGMVLQWQYMPEEEETWQDISGATESIYFYVFDEENAGWLWRLLITVPEENKKAELGDVSGVAEEDVHIEEMNDIGKPIQGLEEDAE